MIALLWVVYGYSLAFAAATARAALSAISTSCSSPASPRIRPLATFSAGVVIPELTFVVFQLTFAAITPALIIGAIAERIKFGAVMLFLVLWFTFSYLPHRAHGLVVAAADR